MPDGVSSLLDSIPDEWGRKVTAESGAVTRTQTGPNSIEFMAPAHVALVLLTPQLDRVASLSSDRRQPLAAPVGTLEIVPANAELFARWTTAKEILLVALEPEKLARLAGLEFQTEDFEFRPPSERYVDEKALLLANMIRDEFQRREAGNDIYFDSLITVFSTYLLRNYSSLSDGLAHPVAGGLATKAWRNVQHYIRAHLADELSVNHLALAVGLSTSHFLRAFRETAGRAPHQYVLATRLEFAERMIVPSDLPLSKIARIAGFSSHSHMTTTMRRNKAITPSALRRDGASTRGR